MNKEYKFIQINSVDGSYRGVVNIDHILSVDCGVEPFDYCVFIAGESVIPVSEDEYLTILAALNDLIVPRRK